MLKIWFNHWFRTAYSLVELMKRGAEEPVYIIGTHSLEYSPIRNMCDEWYKEEYLPEDEYVDFCVNFCKEHDIDVFVPHRYMTAIMKNQERFDRLGVKLFSNDYRTLSIFEDKARAYRLLEDTGVNIPDYLTATTAEEFAEAFKEISEKYGSVCIKFDEDEGAQSFRRITQSGDPFTALHRYKGFSATYDEVYSALSTRESFDELMIMPYLDGVEVSVDCLKTDDGVIALPRFKGAGHIESLRFDDEILGMTSEILNSAKLEYPCDVQFKYLGDKPYLLEVNARMSGGLPMNCEAAGVNIPSLALKKLLGKPCPTPAYDKTEKIFSNVELPILIAG